MPDELIKFRWFRDPNPDNYKIQYRKAPKALQAHRSDGRIGVIVRSGVSEHGPEEGLVSYVPLSGLHEEFINDVTDEASALDFVKKYGFLGGAGEEWVLGFAEHGPASQSDSPLKLSESADYILTCAKRMKSLTDRVKETHERISKLDKDRRKTTGKGYRDRERIIAQFNNHVSPTATVKLAVSSTDSNAALIQLVPKSLASWMWIRCAEDLTNRTVWRECSQCTVRFSVDLKDNRSRNREYCGQSACKQRGKREKDRLRAEGKLKDSKSGKRVRK